MEAGNSILSPDQIEIDFAELHAPLFLGGKNHQLKLTAGARSELRLVYDRAQKELLVFWKGPKGIVEGIVPIGTVLSMIPKKAEVVEIKAPKPTGDVVLHTTPKLSEAMGEKTIERAAKMEARSFTAQVSTPQDHVFQGIGKGKTGK